MLIVTPNWQPGPRAAPIRTRPSLPPASGLQPRQPACATATLPPRIRREDRILAELEAARDEIVAFTADMIRIPTVNPPGECYRDCAELIGRRLQATGLAVEYVEAEGRPEHTAQYPRVNVVGRGPAVPGRPRLHLNGHFDVVPPGDGWTVDPFAGLVRNGRILRAGCIGHEVGDRRRRLRGRGASAGRSRARGSRGHQRHRR